jgi:DNA polymerase II small subunit/DNA polymerase delta subunit B
MQSESELAAEKAAIEKDLEDWKLLKEELEDEYRRGNGKDLYEALSENLNTSRTGHPLNYTLGGQDQSPIRPIEEYNEGKYKIEQLVNLTEDRNIEDAKDKFLKKREEARKLEKEAQDKTQQQELEKTSIEGKYQEAAAEVANHRIPSIEADREAAEQRIRELEEQWAKHEQEICKDRGGREL